MLVLEASQRPFDFTGRTSAPFIPHFVGVLVAVLVNVIRAPWS
jgi:hypothetical protein